ncbi:MAG: LysM peptidoglycan-binding domain-containing protein, partial [Firmicutes bacterium]|nr:LysM peptidoglycan-binding domain-containing protein [Bacillota bacterium]
MHKSESINKSLCSTVHTVASGETLYQIARQHGTDYQRLMTLNGITNPYNIQPGQRICIPQ